MIYMFVHNVKCMKGARCVHKERDGGRVDIEAKNADLGKMKRQCGEFYVP